MTGDRPLAVWDRRRVTRPGQRRALRRQAARTRCPSCRKSYALVLLGGHLAPCRACAAHADLHPTFDLRPRRDRSQPPYWTCTVTPKETAP